MTSNSTTEHMTHEQIKAAVASALTPEAVSMSNKEGESLYDKAGELIKALSRKGMSEEIVDVLVEIGRENVSNDVSWWLRFLSLFHNVRQMTTAQRMEIGEALIENAPRAPTACAYVLRFLAYSGCPIAWDQLPESFDASTLTLEAPLEFTDALVWAQRYDEALGVLSAYLTTNGSKELVARMNERWADLEPSRSSHEFVDAVNSLLKDEGREFATLEEFGDDIREVPRGYDANDFRMTPEPAE